MWDTSGSHRFKYITTAYFKGADIILLCYSVTDKDSFINVDFWINEIAMYCTYINHVSLIALQTDSPNRIISKNEGLDLAAIWKETLILVIMTLILLGISIRKFKIRLE